MARKRNKKWLWISGGMILIIIAVVVGIIIWQNDVKNQENQNEELTQLEEQEKQKEMVEGSQTDEENFAEEEVEKKKVVQYEGDDPNAAGELTGVLTYADVNSGKLMIRVSIDQYLTSGTCELTLNRSGAKIYSDTANIIGDVSTATCEGFDVSVGELGGGKVEINIKVNADGKSGVIRGEANI